MFDKLVESTKQKQGGGAGRYFVTTSLIYLVALVAFAVMAIIEFSPVLAENSVIVDVAPPPLPEGRSAPTVKRPRNTVNPQPGLVLVPPRPTIDIPPPGTVDRTLRLQGSEQGIPGAPPGAGNEWGRIGGRDEDGPPAAPPPTPPPTPAPQPDRGPIQISVGVLQGKAISKPKPAYPEIARRIHANGPVQVLVTISEDGRVIEARALNGHPMLKGAAEAAARQWLFTPTLLNRAPVKVQGVLTFNFILE